MSLTLENEVLAVAVDPVGAQVLSVRDRAGTEYMWQRSPEIWPRTAPLLFPVIGRLRDGGYTLDGRRYPMERHGFARDLPFTVARQSRDAAVLTLASDERTRACYPYDFTLEVRYELSAGRLRKTHTVTNRSPGPMWFELGGHDGFRVALEPGEAMGDYYLRFPGQEALHPLLKGEGFLFARGRGDLPLDGDRLWLSMDLFRRDAIVLDRLPGRRVSLCNARGTRRLDFAFPDFPLLGVWTPDKPFDTNFVCLEAWSSLPDSEEAGTELSSKRDVCRLEAGARRSLCYETDFLADPSEE